MKLLPTLFLTAFNGNHQTQRGYFLAVSGSHLPAFLLILSEAEPETRFRLLDNTDASLRCFVYCPAHLRSFPDCHPSKRMAIWRHLMQRSLKSRGKNVL